MEEKKIKFYSVNETYGEFSNFALYPIKLKGKIWPTTEHYFQAQKFVGKSHEEKIRKAKSPMQAAQLGRNRKIKIKKNWDNIKENVMYEALKAKFTQYKELTILLVETEDNILIEHTELDNYWGDGGNGTGKNRLGKLLMRLRSKLKES